MIPACSLKSIQEALKKKQATSQGSSRQRNEPVVLYQMIQTSAMQDITSIATDKEQVIGILLIRPTNKLAKDEIINELPDFHHMSGKHINFYLPGYGADWQDWHVDDRQPVVTIDGTPWYFSTQLFHKFTSELKEKVEWEYSGDCDLLLLSVNPNEQDNNSSLNFSSGIFINVTEMLSERLIISPSNLFYKIFNAFEANPQLSLKNLSNLLARTNGGKAICDMLGIIPNSSGPINAFKRLKPYAVKKI